MGSTVFSDFMNNPIVQGRADIRRIALDDIRKPQRNSTGGILHGEVSEGAYMFRIWTYPELYDIEGQLNNEYVNPKKFFMIPESPNFTMSFAAVPQLLGKKANVGAGVGGKRGAFLVGEYLDERNSAHIIDIKSAGVPIPVAVDTMYTQTTVDT